MTPATAREIYNLRTRQIEGAEHYDRHGDRLALLGAFDNFAEEFLITHEKICDLDKTA